MATVTVPISVYFCLVWVIFCVTFSYLLYSKRNTPIVKSRIPLIILSQGILECIAGILKFVELSMIETSEYNLMCEYVVLFNEYSYFGVLYLMRCYVYAYQYFVSQRRAGKIDASSMPWIFKHAWIVSNGTIVSLYIFLFTLYEAPAIVVGILYSPVWDPASANCISDQLGIVRWISLGLILLPTIVIVFLLRTSKDAFHIKTEMKIWTVIWIIIIVVYGVVLNDFYIFPDKYLVGCIVYIFGHLTAFCTHTVWIYFLSLKSEKISGIAQKLNSLSVSSLVADGRLRQLLFEFLTQRFCVENLLFWEDVMLWKQTEPTYLQNFKMARTILDKYILTGAPLEVNIEYSTKLAIMRKYNESCSMEINLELDTTIFDEALQEVETLIVMHSYPQFKEYHRHSQLPI